jgi:nucleoid DNA-binding protein
MKPKKSKTFIKKTAEDLSINETIIEDVVDFYWKKIRVSLSNLEYININILNLGSFKIRASKISLIKDKYEKYIRNLEVESMTFDKHITKNNVKEKIKKLNEIEKDIKQYHKRKKEIKNKREEYINNKNLESKESNS